MERHEVMDLMRELKLVGMRAAYDEVLSNALKRQHPAAQIVGNLLQAEIAEKQARSIRYQVTVAKLPLIKDLAEFDFSGTPINEGLVREMATGSFLDGQRNAVLVGGIGTGKTHLAVAIALSCIRPGRRVRFYTVIDLVTGSRRKPAPARQGGWPSSSPASTSSCWTSSATCRLPERGPAAVPPDQPPLRADLGGGHHQPAVCRMAVGVQRREDDDGPARPAHPPLRHHRDRQ